MIDFLLKSTIQRKEQKTKENLLKNSVSILDLVIVNIIHIYENKALIYLF